MLIIFIICRNLKFHSHLSKMFNWLIVLSLFSSATGCMRANHVSWIFSDKMITITMAVWHVNSSSLASLPQVSHDNIFSLIIIITMPKLSSNIQQLYWISFTILLNFASAFPTERWELQLVARKFERRGLISYKDFVAALKAVSVYSCITFYFQVYKM